VLWGACGLLVIANVVNIGADLGGMAQVMELLTGIDGLYWTPIFAILITSMLFWSSYRMIARIFKWLTLVLFSYVISAFMSKPDWYAVVRSTFIPHVEWSSGYIATLVGLFGTTISPYLFFWQAAQEVEEEKSRGRHSLDQRQGATAKELKKSKADVLTGMFFSNFVMYFIILTTAATLHATGHTHIGSAKEAAEALRPMAGRAAYWLFALGLIGAGMLGIPVLAGSCAYALVEAADHHGSLEDRPRGARGFYTVIGIAMGLGMLMNYADLDAVSTLFWAAVVNGVLAPPLIVLVVLLTSDAGVMGKHANSRPLRWLGWICAGVMTAAAIALFVV
jgi:Mn2+/Fe2+ NRAMP family transporter